MAKRKKGPFQIGIIGGGMIAQAHMKNFVEDKRTELAWVADISKPALKKAQETFGVAQVTTDYKEMLAEKALDAVVVCTPPDSHFPIGRDVMRAKKHLLLEKPLTLTVADAKKLLAESKKHRGLIISGCSARHARLNPKFAWVKKMIDSGKLGKVYHIHHKAISRQGRPGIEFNPKAKWFLDRKRAGGGPMYDWGVYDLSFHLGVVGDPAFQSASAFAINGLDSKDAGTKVFTVEEHAGAMMKFKGDVSYYWERSSNAHDEQPNQTVIYGTKGGLKFSYTSWDDTVDFFWIDRNGKGKPKSKTHRVNMKSHKSDMYQLGKAFVDALEKKGPVPMPLATEVANLNIIQSVYKAAKW